MIVAFVFVVVVVLFFSTSLCHTENSGRLTWVRHSRRKSSDIPFHISVCGVCVCPDSGMFACVFVVVVVVDMGTYVDAHDFTRGLYGYRTRVCTRS